MKRKTKLIVGMNRPSPKGYLIGLVFLAIGILFYIKSFFDSSINWIPIAVFIIPGIWFILKTFISNIKSKGGM
ncbi:MAG: hypothetical protein CMP61_05630 [Flavobacteriales bacterium]|nr:hypothetical protein [Flavobacteriales bacterium]|tara:strand:- start:2724 stop:2942 length:219 start_codon:yes stop_codon:yes gene_type:complete